MNTEIRAAIAKIEVIQDEKILSRGTGTLVGPDLVLTALHVVANRKSATLDLHPGTITLAFPGHSTTATVLENMFDASADWVLLKCDAGPRAAPVPVGSVLRDGGPWETFGFPDANPRDGMVQSGTVKMCDAELSGSPAYQLYSEEAAAGEGAPVKGLSGAPVLVEDTLVGVLRFALMKDEKTIAGTVYACPASVVAQHATFLEIREISGGRLTRGGIQQIVVQQLGMQRARYVGAGIAGVVAVASFLMLGGTEILNPPPANSIAVLPFENVASSANPVLVSGLDDEIVSDLYNFRGMVVTTTASAAQFATDPVRYRDIRRGLRVANVLTGRVTAVDSIVRVSVALSETPRGGLIWAQDFDFGAGSSVLGVQDSLAIAVATHLGVTPTTAQRQRIEGGGTRDTLAYEHYQFGNSLLLSQNNAFAVSKAIRQFELAVARDPNFSEAFAGLSRGHSLMYFGDWDVSPARDSLSRAAADRALSVAVDSAPAYMALGLYYYRVKSDYDRALAAIDSAWAFEPANSDLLATRGAIQRRAGMWMQAVSSMEAAYEGDEGSSGKAYTAAQTQLFLRRFDDAEEYFEHAVNAPGATHIATLGQAGYYMARNRPADALGVIRAWLTGATDAADTAAMMHGLIIDEFRPLIRILDPALVGRIAGMTLADAAQDTAFHYLSRMEVFRLQGQPDSVRANADSLLAVSDRRLALQPEQASYHIDRAQALAGLDRFDEAVAAGRHAVDLAPLTSDSYKGMMLRWYLTEIYLRAGRVADVIPLVRDQLAVPGYLSLGWMSADPLYRALTRSPDFPSLTQTTF